MPVEPLLNSVREPSKGDSLPKKSETSKVIHSETWWAKVPVSVIRDGKLSDRAKIVYVEIVAQAFRRNANIGQRLIAQNLGYSQMTVSRKVKELVAAGHLKRVAVGKGQRSEYEPTSVVFTASGVECAHCHKVRRVGKDCYCATCRAALKLEGSLRRARGVGLSRTVLQAKMSAKIQAERDLEMSA
jgi:DNA-binding MarR family transcriptional regulator